MDIEQIREAFSIPKGVRIISAEDILPRGQAAATARPVFDIRQGPAADPELYRSSLGTPVYADLAFLPISYATGVQGITKLSPSIRLESVLVTINQAKVIVRTQIQGRNGTVKEYIGLDDYEVTINGILTGDAGVRPVQEIADLKAMLDAPIAIPVASAYLQAMGIDQIVVSSYNLDQSEGSYTYQTFSINALSDTPQELRLTNV